MNKAFLYEMLRTESVSGGEIPLQKKVAAYMREQGAEVETDLAGDVISSINSASPFRVLLCGHIDEIGFRVTHITDDGYLQVGKAGGIRLALAQGKRVTVLGRKRLTGVMGLLLRNGEVRTDIELTDLYIDCGFTSRAEALEEFFTRGGACFGGGDRFRISTVKLLADGSLGARTAFLREPYSDAPDTCGLPIYPEQAQLDRLVVTAHRHNMAVAIHAIGDGAAEMVLNAFQRARAELPWLHPRHGMVHCQILSEGQLRRMAELDVTAFVQPVFINGDMHIAPGRLGGKRLAHSYAWGDMERLGLHMAFGTDCPVECFHPLEGVYCAVTRRDFTGNGPFLPEQALTPYQALYAYTAGGAYASGEERIKGRIRSGLLADFLLVDRNLLTCPPEELLSARVLRTYVGGACVFRDPSF